MNILPKKSWHVRNKDNIARVRRDEAKAAEEEREAQRRVRLAEQEARTEFLRRKARVSLGKGEDLVPEEEKAERSSEDLHLNLFPVEDAGQKKENEEYVKEKKEEKERQERAIGLLVSLGPPPGTQTTPWYLKERGSSGTKEEERDNTSKSKGSNWTEVEKKDKKLKDHLDPLKEMKKAMRVKGEKERKYGKKKEKTERGLSSGDSSIERLRAERLQREAEERKRAQALVKQKSGGGKEAEQQREVHERDRPYNSAYFPELARKRQRRDRDYYGF